MTTLRALIPSDQTLQKPVIGITEPEKNLLKTAINKWGEQAKAAKSHKSVKYIVERDKLLTEWLFHTGMRISDALLIKLRDISMENEEVTFIVKKRSRTRPFVHTIILSKEILFDIQRFKEMFLIEPEMKLFDLKRATFDENLAKYCKLAGLPKYSAHKFRHGCAMKDLDEGMPDFVTSFRLAHSNTGVTNAIYRRMSAKYERQFRQL